MTETGEVKPNIDSSLEGGLDMFELEVRRLWADPEEGKRVSRFADRIAQLIQQDVAELSGAGDGSLWLQLRQVLEDHRLSEDLDYALQARIAWHLLPSFLSAGERCWHLAGLVKRMNPPHQARRFLGRVTRCYLLSMDPECLVMCRGALENAVNAKFIADRASFPVNAAGVQSMKVRLEEAERRGWLKTASANALHSNVWHRGSKAAHGDPSAVGDPLGAIDLTLQALSGLNPPADAQG